MKINKETIKMIVKPIINVVIVLSMVLISFFIGKTYQKYSSSNKKDPNPYSHAFSPEEISIAVNESNELIMIERSTGKYIVYSDKIGHTIFSMYANRIKQEAYDIK